MNGTRQLCSILDAFYLDRPFVNDYLFTFVTRLCDAHGTIIRHEKMRATRKNTDLGICGD